MTLTKRSAKEPRAKVVVAAASETEKPSESAAQVAPPKKRPDARKQKQLQQKAERKEKAVGGPVRFAKLSKRTPLEGITRPVIARIARKGGNQRISMGVFGPTRVQIEKFLTYTLQHAICHAEYSKRSTLTPKDLEKAYARQGRAIY